MIGGARDQRLLFLRGYKCKVIGCVCRMTSVCVYLNVGLMTMMMLSKVIDARFRVNIFKTVKCIYVQASG